MSLPLFFNKIALRSTINDDSVSYLEEDTGGNLSLNSGSNKIKLNGDVEYEDGDGSFINLKTKIDELEAAGGIGFETTPIENSADGITSGGVYDAISNIDLSTKQDIITSSTNLTLNELSIANTIIRNDGVITTTSGDLNLFSTSGRINLASTNIHYDLDEFGNSANLKSV